MRKTDEVLGVDCIVSETVPGATGAVKYCLGYMIRRQDYSLTPKPHWLEAVECL